jgi:HAD superfamily hydrolase (TIGR01509 family)
MDGVIYDSMGYHSAAWSSAFEYFGIDFPPEMAYLNEGRTAASTINLIYQKKENRDATDHEIKMIYTKKSEIFEKMPKSVPVAGIRDFMEKVKQEGLGIWVVTGSAQTQLLEGLVTEFQGLVSHQKIVSALDVKFGKPHPEPYLKALQKSGLSANETIVVENAPLGIESAKAAGIYTIAVNTGILDDQLLHDSGADVVLKDMRQLKEEFCKIST